MVNLIILPHGHKLQKFLCLKISRSIASQNYSMLLLFTFKIPSRSTCFTLSQNIVSYVEFISVFHSQTIDSETKY